MFAVFGLIISFNLIARHRLILLIKPDYYFFRNVLIIVV
jgi:hypothetical protein